MRREQILHFEQLKERKSTGQSGRDGRDIPQFIRMRIVLPDNKAEPHRIPGVNRDPYGTAVLRYLPIRDYPLFLVFGDLPFKPDREEGK